MSQTVKVLFVAGNSRSGSTILGNTLGQIPGFCCIGEAQRMWEKGWLKREMCSCGQPIPRCSFWSRVLATAFGDGGLDTDRLRPALNDLLLMRHLLRARRIRSTDALSELQRELMDRLAAMYGAIQRESGAAVIVDTSKYPTFAYAIRLIPSLDVYVVHLVRDSRAVAYSWRRKKAFPSTDGVRFMERHTTLRSAAAWMILNGATAALWGGANGRYQRVRYFDFIGRPRETIQAILAQLGEPRDAIPLDEDNCVQVGPHHNVAGNANRFQSGRIPLRLDSEWQTRMDPIRYTIVTLLTLPLLQKFGFEKPPNRPW